VRLGVLGPLLVVDDAGEPVPLTGRPRTLLAAVLTRPNRVRPVDELAGSSGTARRRAPRVHAN
jgi:hypothetical protein